MLTVTEAIDMLDTLGSMHDVIWHDGEETTPAALGQLDRTNRLDANSISIMYVAERGHVLGPLTGMIFDRLTLATKGGG